MLFLAALVRVWRSSQPESIDLMAEARARVGHAGLTIIALAYVLVAFWGQ